MSKYDAPTDFNFGANLEPAASDFKTRDPPTYACTGRVTCAACNKFFGYHDAVPDMLQEIQALKNLVRDGLNYDLLEIPYPPRPFQLIPEAWERGKPKLDWSNEPMDLKSHRSKDRPGAGGKFARRPFLKAKDIPAKGMKCKIIDFRTAPKQMEYSDFLLDVSNGKKEYTVGLRSQTVLLDMLMDELGTKTEKWPGKSVLFVKGGQKGQYINVG